MFCPITKCLCSTDCTFWNKDRNICFLVKAASNIPKQLEEIERQLHKLNKK